MSDRQYELVFILPPETTEEQVTELHGQLEAVVSRMNGQVEKMENWGRRRLAYPIRGMMDGTYVLMTLRLPAAGAAPVEAWLLISDPVLRHLLIRGIIPFQGRDRDRDDRDDRDERDDRDDREDRDERDDREERAAPQATLDDADRDIEALSGGHTGATLLPRHISILYFESDHSFKIAPLPAARLST